jgi:hypothetical protein
LDPKRKRIESWFLKDIPDASVISPWLQFADFRTEAYDPPG